MSEWKEYKLGDFVVSISGNYKVIPINKIIFNKLSKL